MKKIPKPNCPDCGKLKEPGQGRKFCRRCSDARKPRMEQERYKRRMERLWQLRQTPVPGKPYRGEKPEGQDWCPRCFQFLDMVEFNRNKGKGNGKNGYCKICYSIYLHERNLAKNYGITIEQYEEMLARQNGKCGICLASPKARRLAVDHDHKSGINRGLLCTRCNHKLLGSAHDDVQILLRAVMYLKYPPAQSSEWHAVCGKMKKSSKDTCVLDVGHGGNHKTLAKRLKV